MAFDNAVKTWKLIINCFIYQPSILVLLQLCCSFRLQIDSEKTWNQRLKVDTFVHLPSRLKVKFELS